MIKKPMMTQMAKENPRSLKTLKLPSEANLLLKTLSRKNIFAKTPNT